MHICVDHKGPLESCDINLLYIFPHRVYQCYVG
jgi:hypothetical protein